MFASAKKIAGELKLNVPIITYQGSLIKNMQDEHVLYERSVPAEVARIIFDYCFYHGYHLQAYVNDKLYVREDNQKAKDYARNSNIPYEIATDFESLCQQKLTKLLIIDEPTVLDEMASELKNIVGDTAYITKSKPMYLEIMHPEGTKAHALRFLASSIGCKMDEVIAIGDSWNDHEMIEVAGLGVAMANAVDSLKAVANYITLSNNEEGVKHVLEKFIFNPRLP